MTSFSSESDRGTGQPDRGQVRDINAQMTAKLLDAPAQPLTEGSYALRVLESRGRTSGAARHTPIGVLQRDDKQYLVSPDRSRDWVRNLRHDPACAIQAGPQRDPRHATEVGGGEAAGAVKNYLTAVTTPWALRAFPFTPDTPVDEIEKNLAQVAVFRLDPIDD